ncbi:alpha/beta hydrolase-fold protein [Tenacibaculum sp. IB213877]|uniref:alpha/beta hydrolase-fold protein n=1 Tax=Tenacibaculum sp. IB213877 TaxID=3097351 RepID=UPI002A59CEB6|nr:alpha/beta hydrolase-fold protein [Tenacibaculum sp. IB213877]MDY0780983.1 alpha/beta hydrolase-fold protein [Tenacibaculum sp. IB213877]
MKKILLITILHLFIYKAYCQSKINIGEKYKIFSKVLNEEREYWVYLPENYNDTIYAPEKYPVVYFLDGDRHFHSLTGVHDFLSKGPYASLPQMIFVGILTTKNRSRDLTPTRVKESQTEKNFLFKNSGGNDLFIKFLKNELIPQIKNNYRTSGYKTMIGHSFGGLTVLNTWLTQPTLFNSYIAIDPSIWWDNEYILKIADNKLKNPKLEKTTLYFTLAHEETTIDNTAIEHENAIKKFKDKLGSLQSKINWKYQFLKEEDHGTISLPSEYYGLRFVYKGYQLPVKLVARQPSIMADQFQELSKRMNFNMKPAESRVDWIASYAFKNDQKEAAIKLLETNLSNYPYSENAYISLFKTYQKIKSTSKAEEIVKKGLKKFPNSKKILQLKTDIESIKN